MPMGIANSEPSPVTISVPTMALAIPPPDSPTGFGIFVKKSQFSAWTPSLMTKNSTNASGTSAISTESAQKPTNADDSSFRVRCARVTRPPPISDPGSAGGAFAPSPCSR